jgi:hypothetical protein
MEKNVASVRLQRSKDEFAQRLAGLLDKLDQSKRVKISPGESEGPIITFLQDNEVIFFLEVYHSAHRDHRLEFISIAKEVLKDHNFKCEI